MIEAEVSRDNTSTIVSEQKLSIRRAKNLPPGCVEITGRSLMAAFAV